ncbi:MAG: hypothetical protein DRJ05_02555 [Bacteroidetes bacterium]|nr:MAG: hypothetical protein DRJ05_02555 [Bacteroidota bacterium]
MNYLFHGFSQKPPFSKLLFLLFIILVSFVVVTLVGLVVAIPFFGIGVLTNLEAFSNIQNEGAIVFIKYFQVINQIGIFVVPAFLYACLEKNKPLSYLQLNRKINFQSFIFSVLIILSSLPAINWMVELNEQMKFPGFLSGLEAWMKETEEKTKQITDVFLKVNSIGGLLINLLIIAFFAALGEELLFRGVILKLLTEWTRNIHWGIFLSAALFSAIHMQFYGFLPRMALGVLFGYIFVWSGSLWIPIALHFIFNGITVVASYLNNIGAISIDPDSLGASSNTLVISISFTISMVFLILLYREKGEINSTKLLEQKKEESPIEDSSL